MSDSEPVLHSLSASPIELLDRLEHRNQILHGSLSDDVVDGVEYISAVPEGEPFAVFVLHHLRIHTGSRTLNRRMQESGGI